MQQVITLDALMVLDAIDRRGSFAAAAESLHRVPSAITYTVQKLEQDLGIVLFVREGRRSVMTPAGRLLLERGRELLEAAGQLAESAREVDSGWESSLDIVVDAALGVDHLYPLLQAFYAIKPDIEINLYEEVLGGGWEALRDKRADLAVGLPAMPAKDRAIRAELYTSLAWVFVVPCDHPLAGKSVLKPADIEPFRGVVARDSARHTPAASSRLLSSRPALRVPSVRDKVLAQKAGLGVGFLPVHLIERELARGELVALDIEGVGNNTPLYIAWRRGRHGKALSWFIEQLKARS